MKIIYKHVRMFWNKILIIVLLSKYWESRRERKLNSSKLGIHKISNENLTNSQSYLKDKNDKMKFLRYLYGQKLNDIVFPRKHLLRSCIVNTAVYCTKHQLFIHAWNKFRLHWQQIVLICYLMWTTTCKPFIRITSALTKYSTHFKSQVGLKSDFISKSVISSPLYFKLYWSCIVCKLHVEVRRLKAYSVQIINIKRAAIAAAPFALKSWQGKPHVTPCCQLPGHWTINILRYVCFVFLHANTCLDPTDFRPNFHSEKYF